MRRIAVVYGLVAVFFGSERLLRQGSAATRLQLEETDQGSTRAVGQAIGIAILCLLAAPILNALDLGTMRPWTASFRVGVSATVCGLLLRVWAMQVLGAAFTRTLRVAEQQQIIEEGPYQIVRHPGYAGTLLVCIGATVALANWIAVSLAGSILLRAYRCRMGSEEKMLVDRFGEGYRGYMKRTWRLVPFVY